MKNYFNLNISRILLASLVGLVAMILPCQAQRAYSDTVMNNTIQVIRGLRVTIRLAQSKKTTFQLEEPIELLVTLKNISSQGIELSDLGGSEQPGVDWNIIVRDGQGHVMPHTEYGSNRTVFSMSVPSPNLPSFSHILPPHASESATLVANSMVYMLSAGSYDIILNRRCGAIEVPSNTIRITIKLPPAIPPGYHALTAPRSINGLSKGVRQIAFLPDGKTLAMLDVATPSHSNNEIELWDIERLTAVRNLTLERVDGKFIRSLSFSLDGKNVAGVWDAGDAYRFDLWNATTGKLIHFYDLATNSLVHVAFWPDNKTLTSVSAFDIKQWDAKTYALLRHKRHPFGAQGALAFSADSKTIASALAPDEAFGPEWRQHALLDSKVQLWNGLTGDLKGRGPDQYWVDSLAFAPDGATLAIGCHSGEIVLWHTQRHQILQVLAAHKARVAALAFAPDGSSLASSGVDGTVKIWQLQKL